MGFLASEIVYLADRLLNNEKLTQQGGSVGSTLACQAKGELYEPTNEDYYPYLKGI